MPGGEYGKIFKRVWGDADFKTLTADQQLMYFKLISQPDVSLAGVVTLATTRWATQTGGATVAFIEATLAELEAARYVVVDRETQEVLIRSYVRYDGCWRSPKTMKGITSAIERVLSPKLRSAICAELQRVDTSVLSDRPSDTYGHSTREYIVGVIERLTSENPPRNEGVSEGVSEGVPDTPCEGVSEGVSLARAAVAPAPAVATTPAPAPATAPSGGTPSGRADTLPGLPVADAPAHPEGQTPTQTLVGEWLDHCKHRPPSRVIGQTSKQIKTLIEDGFTPEQIRPGLARWTQRGLDPGSLASVVNETLNSTPNSRRTGQPGLSEDQWAAAFQRAAARDRQEAQV